MKTLITAAALAFTLLSPALAQSPAPAPAAPATKTEAPKAPPAQAAPAAKAETPKASAPAASKADAKAAAKLINVNTATAAELDALPKIGEARSKAIIAGRPYKSVDDLLAKKVLPQDAFDAIKAKISVK